MSSYFVVYTAYIDERKRPENFPRYVQIREVYDNIESTDHLKHAVNTYVTKMASAPGIVVFKDPDEIVDTSLITFDKRRFIPWHMITHVEMTAKVMFELPSNPIDAIAPIDPKPPKSEGKPN